MTNSAPGPDYDYVVVGAGIVGSAIARALAGYQHRVALVEARDDVGDGTSKANTAILHTGFDAKPGTLESRMVSRGYTLLADYATHTGIPVERTGALLVAWNDEELAALPGLQAKAVDNGYTHCEIVDADEVYRQVPASATEHSAARRCPTSRSSAPGRPTSRWRPTQCAAGSRCAPAPAPTVTRRKPTTRSFTQATATSPPAGSSTPPGWVRITSIRPSATTASTSPPAAANCSSTTNWPAP